MDARVDRSSAVRKIAAEGEEMGEVRQPAAGGFIPTRAR
jgi:hypothetical protein